MPTPEELWDRYRVTGHLNVVRATPDPLKHCTIDVRVAHASYDPSKPATFADLHLLVEPEDVPHVRGGKGQPIDFIFQALAVAARPAASGPLGLETWPAAESQTVPHASRMLRRDVALIGRQTCQDPSTYRIHFGSGIHAFVTLVTAERPAGAEVVNGFQIEYDSLWVFQLSVPFHAIFLKTLRRWSARPGRLV